MSAALDNDQTYVRALFHLTMVSTKPHGQPPATY
jgi:hypothetical protein